ncbi:MAG: WecB/TagA/CpsF family glycosyltransferase [Parcubacteria group bacterium]
MGIRVDNLTKTEVLEKVNEFLREEKIHQIATVNPEFILKAQKDEEFKKILNSCDLNVADGVGIKFAFWRYGQKLKTRIVGVDLTEDILKIAEKDNIKIFLVANGGGLSTWEETREAILKKYPKLQVSGANLSSNITGYKLPIIDYSIILCSFGAPFQEKFLHSLKSQESAKIKLAIGVGGSFDYLTGKVKRAPRRMRQIGLEWLFRLLQEPRYRIKKIFNAVIIFPIKIIFSAKGGSASG